MTPRIYIRRAFRAILIAAALICADPANAADIFEALTDMNQVESSFVSGRFSHNYKTWRSSDYQHSMDLSDGFSSLYNYKLFSKEAVAKADQILKSYLKQNPDVELMQRNSSNSLIYAIYEQFNEEGKLIKMIIINKTGPNVGEILVVNWKNGYVRKNAKKDSSELLNKSYDAKALQRIFSNVS